MPLSHTRAPIAFYCNIQGPCHTHTHNVTTSHQACRTLEKAEATAKATGAAGFYECDLSSLQSVQRFCDAWGAKPIDVLCLNAGVAMNTGDKTPKYVCAWLEA